MNGKDALEDTFGIACYLRPDESTAVQFIELDCAGRADELRRLRSSFAARRYNHFVRVDYRRKERGVAGQYLYGATLSAAQALHRYLRDPAAAKAKGESLGSLLDRMKKEGGIISDSELKSSEGSQVGASAAEQHEPPLTPLRHKRNREDSHSPTSRRTDFRMNLGDFEKKDAATPPKNGDDGERVDGKERCRDCGLVCEHPNSPRQGECQCANSCPCSPCAQASLQPTQKKEDEVIVID
jgi:hypothetical protein